MKKRLLAVLLCAVMALSLGACGDSNKDNTEKEIAQPSVKKLADFNDLSAILDEIADNNAREYFTELVYEAGIGAIKVTDRDIVQEGDIVSTDYTGYVDGVAFSGGSTISNGESNPQWIDVSNNCGVNMSTGTATSGYIEGFTDGLVGAKIGEKTSSQVTFPDPYTANPDLAGQLTTFEFDVKEIYEKTTPENITDAMVAEKFSESYGVSTVADFMKVLKEEAAEVMLNSYFSEVVYSAGLSVVEVKDRDTVQKGDIVKADYTGYYEGVEFKGGSAKDQLIDLSSNCSIDASTGAVSQRFDAGFSDCLIGAKIGVEKSADLTLPKTKGETTLVDGDDKSDNDVKVDLSNKKVTYKFNVKTIYVEITPDTITDEIVAENFSENYEASTVAEFMQALEKELAYSYVINYMMEKSTFDIPEEYLDKRLDEYQEFFEELYCGDDIDLNTFLKQYYGTTLDVVRVQWAASLQVQIKAELVFEAMVKEAELKVDKKEREEYVEKVIKNANSDGGNSFFSTEDNIYKMIGVGNIEAGKAYLLNQPAVRDYVMENCQ